MTIVVGSEVRIVSLENTKRCYGYSDYMEDIGYTGTVEWVSPSGEIINFEHSSFNYHISDLELVNGEEVQLSDVELFKEHYKKNILSNSELSEEFKQGVISVCSMCARGEIEVGDRVRIFKTNSTDKHYSWNHLMKGVGHIDTVAHISHDTVKLSYNWRFNYHIDDLELVNGIINEESLLQLLVKYPENDFDKGVQKAALDFLKHNTKQKTSTRNTVKPQSQPEPVDLLHPWY